jgi:hypothetical protein
MDPTPTLLTPLLPTETRAYFKRTFEAFSTTVSYTASLAMTPVSSRKRSSPASLESERAPTSEASSDSATAYKRLRLSPPSSSVSTDTKRRSDLPTPPSSPPLERVVRTMRLKLEIPKPELTKEEQRALKLRPLYAQRWRPKLQRPFPKNKEIKDAYKYKLMRHYTDPLAPAISNFFKPRIDRSPRVENLLKRFPLPATSFGASNTETGNSREAMLAEWARTRTQIEQLRNNMRITSSESAQKLAWEAFSSREQDRVDRGREAMMQSGLWSDDLLKESYGVANELPEWRKTRTGRFAKSARSGHAA